MTALAVVTVIAAFSGGAYLLDWMEHAAQAPF